MSVIDEKPTTKEDEKSLDTAGGSSKSDVILSSIFRRLFVVFSGSMHPLRGCCDQEQGCTRSRPFGRRIRVLLVRNCVGHESKTELARAPRPRLRAPEARQMEEGGDRNPDGTLSFNIPFFHPRLDTACPSPERWNEHRRSSAARRPQCVDRGWRPGLSRGERTTHDRHSPSAATIHSQRGKTGGREPDSTRRFRRRAAGCSSRECSAACRSTGCPTLVCFAHSLASRPRPAVHSAD